VIAGGGGVVGTKITSLPYWITNPGFYFLGGDLTSTGDGIMVTTNNVTIDLMGFNLVGGTGGSGIALGGMNNVEIRNGTIRNFEYGVRGDDNNTFNQRLINVRITECLTGVRIHGNNHIVKDCTFSNNTYALYLLNGMISGCVASNNNLGIRLDLSGSVIGNIANNNTGINFYFGASALNTPILVNGNSANGLAVNYVIAAGSAGGVLMGTNAGTP
jgi:hypothetical protein